MALQAVLLLEIPQAAVVAGASLRLDAKVPQASQSEVGGPQLADVADGRALRQLVLSLFLAQRLRPTDEVYLAVNDLRLALDDGRHAVECVLAGLADVLQKVFHFDLVRPSLKAHLIGDALRWLRLRGCKIDKTILGGCPGSRRWRYFELHVFVAVRVLLLEVNELGVPPQVLLEVLELLLPFQIYLIAAVLHLLEIEDDISENVHPLLPLLLDLLLA